MVKAMPSATSVLLRDANYSHRDTIVKKRFFRILFSNYLDLSTNLCLELSGVSGTAALLVTDTCLNAIVLCWLRQSHPFAAVALEVRPQSLARTPVHRRMRSAEYGSVESIAEAKPERLNCLPQSGALTPRPPHAAHRHQPHTRKETPARTPRHGRQNYNCNRHHARQQRKPGHRQPRHQHQCRAQQLRHSPAS